MMDGIKWVKLLKQMHLNLLAYLILDIKILQENLLEMILICKNYFSLE